MIPADEDFDGTWTFRPHFSAAAGLRQHYVDEGAGRPILLLHGQPTWGYIWRRFIPPLAATHRVIVPDHMGFGKTETPPDREYTLRTHVENLTALIEALDLLAITLVMQDWGGPRGTVVAASYPDRVRRFVAMNTIFGTDRNVREERLTPWFTAIKAMEDAGELTAVLGNLKYLIGGVMMMLLVEMLMRRDLDLKVKETVVRVGFVFLMMVVVFVIYNDISRILTNS